MFSENFMRYLINYQTEDVEENNEQKNVQKAPKRHLMVDLIGIKYATVPIRNTAK